MARKEKKKKFVFPYGTTLLIYTLCNCIHICNTYVDVTFLVMFLCCRLVPPLTHLRRSECIIVFMLLSAHKDKQRTD